MCTQAEADTIRKEAGLWMQRGKMFTSVDIANSLKQRGDWIRNRDVAAYLRSEALNFAPQYTQGRYNYLATAITVVLADGSTTQAQLYHPDGSNPASYDARNQRAMSPSEAKSDNPTDADQSLSASMAGLIGGSGGIFADAQGVRVNLNAIQDPKSYDEEDLGSIDAWVDEDIPLEEDEHEGLLSDYEAGVSLAGLKPKPTQEIHINIEHVSNLIISSGEVEFEED